MKKEVKKKEKENKRIKAELKEKKEIKNMKKEKRRKKKQRLRKRKRGEEELKAGQPLHIISVGHVHNLINLCLSLCFHSKVKLLYVSN